MGSFAIFKKSTWVIFAVAAGLSLAFIPGCSGRSQLVPGPGANLMPGTTEAVDTTVEGVQVVVDSYAWNGDPAILDEITPLKVTIKNNSGKSLLVRYRDFAITSQSGKFYAALPPFKITGTVDKPVLAAGYPLMAEPYFDNDGFLIAPYYSEIYPDIPSVYGDDFAFDDFGFDNDYGWPYYDPFYYNEYYTYWATIDLPTPRMLRLALPEGIIKNGGHVSGFLYFQEVSPKLDLVNFRTDLVNAKNSQTFGTATIPFVVKKK
jgi:hypothetical protein